MTATSLDPITLTADGSGGVKLQITASELRPDAICLWILRHYAPATVVTLTQAEAERLAAQIAARLGDNTAGAHT